MNRNSAYRQILSEIPTGAENAIDKASLGKRVEMDERTLRLFIHLMRVSGIPVLTSVEHFGYYLPTPDARGLAECQAFIRNQVNRARACYKSTRGAKAYIIKNCGQLSFIEDDNELASFEANEF